jgi:endoglucanase
MRSFSTLTLLCLIGIIFGCKSVQQKNAGNAIVPDSLDNILVNQVGYLPDAEKIALLKIAADRFEVIDVENGKVEFTGEPGPFKYWEYSGDSVCMADFTMLTKPGKYQVCLNDRSVCSFVFEIGDHIYSDITRAALKAFYLNRTAIEITADYGGKWHRPAGHPDTSVIIHHSATTAQRPEGTIISSPGGWYDAGDYNKYIVNSSISTYTLLLFCQVYPEYCKEFKNNIPESNNNIPDVMDELLVNLRWMLTMQDPNGGGVYHKLTNKAFCDFVMPDKATDPRYVVMKSTAASLDFAATMAMASRVFANTDSPELNVLGKTCLEASKKAYSWAKDNPAIYYKNSSDISTGAYDDKRLNDEFFWAASELAIATSDFNMLSVKALENQVVCVQSWDSSAMLGIISLALCDNPKAAELTSRAGELLIDFADVLVTKSESSPYKVSLDYFKWGSNSDVANQAVIKLVAHKIKPDKKYLNSVQGDIDYLLGRNATGYCFVTGYGTKKVMNIHHRPSGADGIPEPCPGFLVGGPNTIVLNDCPEITRSNFPAKSFTDSECSYSTNEVAINWNAPLFFLMGSMDALSHSK